jgi:hypothetical protein
MEFLIYPASTFAPGFALTDQLECSYPREDDSLLSTFPTDYVCRDALELSFA